MIGFEELAELFRSPEKFFRRPARQNESAVQIFLNVLPYMLLFLIAATALTAVSLPEADLMLIFAGLFVMGFVALLIFLTLTVQLKIFGHSIFRTYQAFAYGLVPFLLLGWLSWFAIVLTFFSTYWGIVVLHKTSWKKALAALILPAIIVIFYLQIAELLGTGIFTAIQYFNGFLFGAGLTHGTTQNSTYVNEYYKFSLDLPAETQIKQDEAYFYFTWRGGEEQIPMEIYVVSFYTGVSDLEGMHTEIKQICEENPDCTPASERRISFLGYESFEDLETKIVLGEPMTSKSHLFYVDGGTGFYVSCTLLEEDYWAGITECERVASTFRYMG